MTHVTRRGFFKQTAVGIGASTTAAGLLVATSHLTPASKQTYRSSFNHSTVSSSDSSETLVVHVRDFATGEISFLLGTREVIAHDPDLVQRLLHAAS